MEPAQNHTHTRALVVCAVLLALVVGGVFLWSRIQPVSVPKSPVAVMQGSVTLRQGLQASNADFAAGMQARKTGDYRTAVSSLEKALQATTDHAQRGAVAYWLADSYSYIGQYQQAIPLLKSIAGDAGYAPIIRAYAVQEMALVFYRLRGEGITAEIFKDQPYAQLQVAGNAALSYRHLLEYASTFYPLALSELHVATWYANDAVVAKKGGGDTSAAIAADTEAVKTHLALADAHKDAVEGGTLADATYLPTLLQRAVLLGKMSVLGDASFGDADAAFTTLLAGYAKSNTTNDGAVRLQYAIYLASKYGKARASDIQSTLAPLIQNTPKRMAQFPLQALQVRGKNGGDLRSSYVLVASLDPDFKKLLVSYGWTEADFTR